MRKIKVYAGQALVFNSRNRVGSREFSTIQSNQELAEQSPHFFSFRPQNFASSKAIIANSFLYRNESNLYYKIHEQWQLKTPLQATSKNDPVNNKKSSIKAARIKFDKQTQLAYPAGEKKLSQLIFVVPIECRKSVEHSNFNKTNLTIFQLVFRKVNYFLALEKVYPFTCNADGNTDHHPTIALIIKAIFKTLLHPFVRSCSFQYSKTMEIIFIRLRIRKKAMTELKTAA